MAVTLAENFYVDDLVTGVSSSNQAFCIYQQANLILRKAGVKLQKWATGDVELRRHITNKLEFGSAGPLTKVLGHLCDTSADNLILNIEFLLELSEKRNDTKTCVLKMTVWFFYPLDWLSSFIVRMKVLFPRLWLHSTAWKKVMLEPLSNQWDASPYELKELQPFSLPRCKLKLLLDKPASSQFYVFTDATFWAYDAAAYLRPEDQCGNGDVQLLFSKGRIAPIKQITLPRLKLVAAVLTFRVLKSLHEVLKLKNWTMEKHM